MQDGGKKRTKVKSRKNLGPKTIKNINDENFLDDALLEDIAVEDHELLHLIEREISAETEVILQCLKAEDRELFEKLYIEELCRWIRYVKVFGPIRM